ncbi:MAG: response regulator [Terracidiphilus sp.]
MSESKPAVLVVDDNHVCADTHTAILNLSGFNATAAYSGERAIEAAIIRHFDYLISGVMIQPMIGTDVAKEICKLHPDCLVLLRSGHAAAADVLEIARSRGQVFEVLPKQSASYEAVPAEPLPFHVRDGCRKSEADRRPE